MRRPQPNYRNSALHAFFREDTSTLSFPEEQEFAPIFPKSRRFGHRSSQISAVTPGQSVKKIAEMLLEANIESDDSDMISAQMNVVNGWR